MGAQTRCSPLRPRLSTRARAQADETQAIADSARADLAEAMPALAAAKDALNALNKKDIQEIKSFTTPPELVRVVMEAVCTLLSQKVFFMEHMP